jgi:hypothetical protein
MTSNTRQKEIEEAVHKLLKMARELTWNEISDNYKFILTEIKDSQENFHVQRQLRKQENDKKVALTLNELMPSVQRLYDKLHDINLHIHRAHKHLTVIDIRYYPKSSLNIDYREKVINNDPMLHCKVAMPPWLTDKTKKFDINWEHKQWLTNWKLFWVRLNRRHQKQLTVCS